MLRKVRRNTTVELQVGIQIEQDTFKKKKKQQENSYSTTSGNSGEVVKTLPALTRAGSDCTTHTTSCMLSTYHTLNVVSGEAQWSA